MLKILTSTLVITIFSLQIHAQSWILYNQSNSGLSIDRAFTTNLNNGTYLVSIKSEDGAFKNYNGKITIIK